MHNADLSLTLKPTLALTIAIRTAGTYPSIGVDVASFDAVYLHFFSSLNSGATGTVRLQTSDTIGGTYTNVPGTAFALSDALDGLPNVWIKARLGNVRQFVRIALVVSTGTPACGAFLYFFDPANGADQNVTHATGA